jgi:hypothetical protein
MIIIARSNYSLHESHVSDRCNRRQSDLCSICLHAILHRHLLISPRSRQRREPLEHKHFTWNTGHWSLTRCKNRHLWLNLAISLLPRQNLSLLWVPHQPRSYLCSASDSESDKYMQPIIAHGTRFWMSWNSNKRYYWLCLSDLLSDRIWLMPLQNDAEQTEQITTRLVAPYCIINSIARGLAAEPPICYQ